ncbi:hypothetical protein JCGZ_03926 [Jatropha curcas]|uniref:Uncharacterized protein n=1 Tax=Jatropha curcas TaxID=180498 RepID=A0A067L5M4_JATCU|nr:hypothetical protein JCGZ_03926 [Jatropha curcas]
MAAVAVRQPACDTPVGPRRQNPSLFMQIVETSFNSRGSRSPWVCEDGHENNKNIEFDRRSGIERSALSCAPDDKIWVILDDMVWMIWKTIGRPHFGIEKKREYKRNERAG